MSNPLSLVNLGTTIAAAFAVFCFLGYWLDQKLGSGYFWTVVGSVLAMVYVFYMVWKLLVKDK